MQGPPPSYTSFLYSNTLTLKYTLKYTLKHTLKYTLKHTLKYTQIHNGISHPTQLAFLATMVGPRVAAAAAKRALEYLGEVEDEEDTPMVRRGWLGSKCWLVGRCRLYEECTVQKFTHP